MINDYIRTFCDVIANQYRTWNGGLDKHLWKGAWIKKYISPFDNDIAIYPCLKLNGPADLYLYWKQVSSSPCIKEQFPC